MGELKPWTFLTYGLLHGNLAHVGLNVLWLVALGAPVARRFGPWRFLALLAVTTVAGALAQTLVHARDVQAIVGASAAVSGTMAAAVRFIFQPGENLGPRPDAADEPLPRAPPLPLSGLFRNRQAVGFLAALVRPEPRVRGFAARLQRSADRLGSPYRRLPGGAVALLRVRSQDIVARTARGAGPISLGDAGGAGQARPDQPIPGEMNRARPNLDGGDHERRADPRRQRARGRHHAAAPDGRRGGEDHVGKRHRCAGRYRRGRERAGYRFGARCRACPCAGRRVAVGRSRLPPHDGPGRLRRGGCQRRIR